MKILHNAKTKKKRNKIAEISQQEKNQQKNKRFPKVRKINNRFAKTNKRFHKICINRIRGIRSRKFQRKKPRNSTNNTRIRKKNLEYFNTFEKFGLAATSQQQNKVNFKFGNSKKFENSKNFENLREKQKFLKFLKSQKNISKS